MLSKAIATSRDSPRLPALSFDLRQTMYDVMNFWNVHVFCGFPYKIYLSMETSWKRDGVGEHCYVLM